MEENIFLSSYEKTNHNKGSQKQKWRRNGVDQVSLDPVVWRWDDKRLTNSGWKNYVKERT